MNRMSEGVGKKIVEALKMQTEDIENISEKEIIEQTSEQDSFDETAFEESALEETSSEKPLEETSFETNFSADEKFEVPNHFVEPNIVETPVFPETDFEIPSNVAVLKNLISKLPSGVTKQTGALIIKQTMEALGISMKSVLQDAQQVQEGLKSSARECQSSIQEYKKQILALEKQSQTYQKQYSALNDLISLMEDKCLSAQEIMEIIKLKNQISKSKLSNL